MTAAFSHRPVMVDKVVALLAGAPPGVVVDATVGGGGHAAALLGAAPHLSVVGVDRDDEALAAAKERLAPFGARARLHRARFDALADAAPGPASGVLFDLGVSSWQLDRPERGFSYRTDAPLDMRMDRRQARTAADVVNAAPEAELAALFAANGEGRFARRLARAVVAARPLETTTALVDVVRDALPAAVRRTGGHPAKRVFQALRIAVNDELDVLGPALDAAVDLLTPGGRLVVIAYHSGEDRIAKRRLAEGATGGCTCPPGLPCGCGARLTLRLLVRGATPSVAEVEANPRAASARLRAAEKLPPTPPEDR